MTKKAIITISLVPEASKEKMRLLKTKLRKKVLSLSVLELIRFWLKKLKKDIRA